jgi:hypothetical protein
MYCDLIGSSISTDKTKLCEGQTCRRRIVKKFPRSKAAPARHHLSKVLLCLPCPCVKNFCCEDHVLQRILIDTSMRHHITETCYRWRELEHPALNQIPCRRGSTSWVVRLRVRFPSQSRVCACPRPQLYACTGIEEFS